MAFKKGQSGNPSGRSLGAKSWHTLLREELREDAPALVSKLKEEALDGDVTALQFLIQAILPRTKATAPTVDISDLRSAVTLSEKARAVLLAIADGDLAPDVGTSLIAAINQTARVVEIEELGERLSKLEEALDHAQL